ncbi:MAG: sigma-70 family RNA polymerase sigma factor [Wenzhouxiangellaceae bacterium]|nr:sigma-70 family RNA polymerase sigma factor [Wenzhouxiangellaceae bacterium]
MELAARKARFDRVVSIYSQDLQRFALWLTRDPEAAQDVVQETLLRAWRSLDKLKDTSAAKAWLITTLRRENARRFERKRFQTVDVDDCVIADDLNHMPDDSAEMRELRNAILALPDAYREPLVLQVQLGHSVKEIARIMGISRSAVMTRLFRARQKVKDLLEPELHDALGFDALAVAA